MGEGTAAFLRDPLRAAGAGPAAASFTPCDAGAALAPGLQRKASDPRPQAARVVSGQLDWSPGGPTAEPGPAVAMPLLAGGPLQPPAWPTRAH